MTVSVEARPAPAKATAVSTPHRHKRAKATAVSDNRAAWSAEPDHNARGRWRGLARQRVDAQSHTSATTPHWYGGHRRVRRTRPRCPWAVAGPGQASRRRAEPHISDPAPQVWRAPEGQEGQAAVPVGGGGAWPGFETTRRAKLAARTASGRAAAHGHTKQPGPTAGASGARNTRGATSNIATPHTHAKTPTRNRVGVSEPPVGIEPTTYSLRVNRSAD